jgi:hypothetical protein
MLPYAHEFLDTRDLKLLSGSAAHIPVLSNQFGREILDIAASHVKPGVTTDFIDEIVHNATIERNAYPSPLNYRGFPKAVCTCVAF